MLSTPSVGASSVQTKRHYVHLGHPQIPSKVVASTSEKLLSLFE
jgi:hypothetical protein